MSSLEVRPNESVTLRLEHGRNRLGELREELDRWSEQNARVEWVLDEPRTTLSATLRVAVPTPTERWSLLLGEAVHSYRSALDNLAWQLAHHFGSVPQRPKQVYFPISSTAADWKSKTQALTNLPDEVLARIHQFQPYLFGEDESSTLEFLHALDIADKHHALLDVTAQFTGSSAGQVLIPYRPGTLIGTEPKMEQQPAIDGAVISRVHLSLPAYDVRPKSDGDKAVLAMRVVHNGDEYGLDDLIEALPEHIGIIIEYICTGDETLLPQKQ